MEQQGFAVKEAWKAMLSPNKGAYKNSYICANSRKIIACA
jgi:hypothetical protein